MKLILNVLALGASLPVIIACASAPARCDLQQPAGACNVRIEMKSDEMLVCSSAPAGQALAVCQNAVVDVTTGKGYTSRKLMLAPGECRSLGKGVSSAAQASCSAFTARPEGSATSGQ